MGTEESLITSELEFKPASGFANSPDLNVVPLSFAQQRLWFLEQLQPNSSLYNIQILVRIAGPLNPELLERALNAIVDRHEILRTKIGFQEDLPAQVISERETISLRQLDLSNSSERNYTELEKIATEEMRRPFDLSKDLLIRALLLKSFAEEQFLVVTMHHIVSDEWSMQIFFRELREFYTAFFENREPSLPPLSIQYADFSIWQREWLQGEALEQQIEYWKVKLHEPPAALELPSDRPRNANLCSKAGNVSRVFEKELGESLRKLANREGATLFMVLLAGFKALLHRYTGREDIIVASPIAGRNRIETEDLIGFFVNTLPFRTRVTGEQTFRDLVKSVRETSLGAYAHQDAPFEKIVEELHPERSSQHLHFTNVMFVVQQAAPDMKFCGLTLSFPHVSGELSKFELTLAMEESQQGLTARAEFNRDLFDDSTIARLLEHLENVLKAMAAQPEQKVCQAPLLSKKEYQQIVCEWNRTTTEYPRQRCVHQVFEMQAAANPDARAVTFNKKSLTYGELNARANQLAGFLKRFGAGPDVRVAICTSPSTEMAIGLLAILKAGGTYVPLDATYPAERLELMLADSQAAILLTEQTLLSRLPRNGLKTICLDTDWELIAREARSNLDSSATAESLAYIMYTSGSTGRPKGVAVPHRAINRLVIGSNYFQLGADDRIAQVSNLSFDAATFEIWGALLNGGELVGIKTDVALSPQDFGRELREHRITAMFLTAALFNQLASEVPGAFSTLRVLIAGGEALDPKWTREVLRKGPPQKLLNGYGPTENTTFSCCHLITRVPEDATNVPIGKPISNTTAYLLDQYLNPVPVGVVGNLYVGGDGLARGYWNEPKLTAERFISNPFGPGAIYNTGDLARYLPDGTIEFLGRKDQQVKIRGFRIELGEIEAVLGQHPGIRDCCVTASLDESGQKRLVGYFVPASEEAPGASSLRRFLSDKLPGYMVPATFVRLTRLPLTSNGKLDRKALPDPELDRAELEPQYILPRDEVERELVKIWEEVLGVKPIGIQDKFFDLGGHSLLAVRLIGQINKVFPNKVRLSTLFQAPTIAHLAAVIRDESKALEKINTQGSVVEIQARGTKPPLFLVHGAGGGMFWGYVNLSRHLGNDQPVYGFRSRGLDGKNEFETLEEMAAQYITDLRSVQPKGPYHLGGYCFGGNVAYEMARQLVASGEEIGLLALINCAPPNSAYGHLEYTPKWVWRFLRNLIYWAGYCADWTHTQRRDFLRWKFKMARKNLKALFDRASGKCSRLDIENVVDLSSFSVEQQRLWETHISAQLDYKPKPIAAKIHLFRSPGHPVWCSFDPKYGWGELATGGVEVTIVPAGHEKILEEPMVKIVAQGIQDIVNARTSFPAVVEQETSSAEQGSGKETMDWFQQQLLDVPELLEFPTSFPRPAKQSCQTGTEKIAAPQNLESSLTKAAQELGSDKLTAFTATLAALLKRYIRQERTVMAIACGEGQFEFSPGKHVSLLPLDVSGDPSLIDLAQRIRNTRDSIPAAKGIPFGRLLQHLHVSGEQSYHPIAQVLLSMESNEDVPKAEHPDMGRFDLHFRVIQHHTGGLTLQIDYAKDLFRPEFIQRVLNHWKNLVQQFSDNARVKVSEARMLSPEEEHTLLNEWTATSKPYPKEKTLAGLFSEQARRTPGRTALVSGNIRLTYRELYERSLVISQQLLTVGVKREQLVGVCLERSWEMVAGILGTLQAGAAYVPMDPAYPKERLEFMAQDAKMPVILTQRKLVASLPKTDARIICVEDLNWQAAAKSDPATEQQSNEANPEATNLAYVIYTSGSTGKPKGVALEHRNAVAFVYWARGVFTDEELAGVLASTSICFDLSIFEMFVPLSWGGKVILAENALALPGIPAAKEVKLINTVPSAIRELLRAKGVPTSVTVVNLAGEPLPTALVEQIYSESGVRKVYDLYGPTETTTYSTFTLRKPAEPATIGRPLANEQVYILDSCRQPVPIGVPGELYIGGDGVARGYLDRPELTAEKFVPHPFVSGTRLYRTGDLARWREDGNLEFLGRIDHQVKIRGFRIELGEVETAVKKQPGIADAVVMAREDVPGNKRLVAYVVIDPKGSLSSHSNDRPAVLDELRRGLRLAIPDYMVPSVFVFLGAIPLTPNGKVDRKALPVPDVKGGADGEEDEPRTPVQEQLTSIWREVLQVKSLRLNDNFFDLGGHSLLAFQIISRIRTTFHLELPLSGFFETPTIASLAEAITQGRWRKSEALNAEPTAIPRDGDLPVSFVQERLWFLHQLNPHSAAYNVPLALHLKGTLNQTALQGALDEIVRRHEALRTRFVYRDGSVKQVIEPFLKVPIQLIEPPKTGLRNPSELEELLSAEARKPFDLAIGPLIRAVLVKLGEAEHGFLIVMHHTISDGWSLALFFRELEMFYRAALQGLSPKVLELPLQYADFAFWHRNLMQNEVLQKEMSYWKTALTGAPPKIELPVDKPETSETPGFADRLTIQFGAELSKGLASLAHSGTTPFMVLLAGLSATLRRWTHQNDMVIGTVVAGRNHQAIENVIGCFMNFLPIRVRSNGTEKADEFLGKVKNVVLEAQAHQECPFEKIVEVINPERKSNQNPLYNVGLLLQNFPAQLFQTESIQSSQIPINLKAALLDLRFEAEETESGFSLTCEYKTDLFSDTTIKQLMESIRGAIELLVRSPGLQIDELRLTEALESQSAANVHNKVSQTIAIAATFTAEPIEESLQYWTKELDLPARIEFAPYHQVFQQLLDPTSLLSANHLGLNVVLLRLEDFQKSSQDHSVNVIGNNENVQRSVKEVIAALQARKRTTPYLICICPPSNSVLKDFARARELAQTEQLLLAELRTISGVYGVGSEELRNLYPLTEYNDPTGDELGHVPYTPTMFSALGTMIARKLLAIRRPPYKVIALDCDQTLWSGVCGEDGPEGIRMDPPRVALQHFMREQKEAGMLLCLCSKNNEDDVWQVFQLQKQMPLRREDFVAVRLNWRAKPENLRSLAEELKVGLDSFIFVDDNPVECAAVQDQCPEATTLLLPENVDSIPEFLKHCWAFDHVSSTSEDRARTEMYVQNQQRERLRDQSISLGDFIKGLDLKIEISEVTTDQLSRVAQLTQRTNQFNFTTRRRTESEIQGLVGASEILSVKVKDRFGDYGLVGVMIFSRHAGIVDVDTFLLSCRVLGRGVEYCMLARLGDIARKSGLGWVDVHFTRSEKNKPALDFLERNGSQFRHALNGGYIYRFPAGVAAGLKLDTQSLEPATVAEESKSEPRVPATKSVMQRFNRYSELALQTMSVEAIHRAIEARSSRRTAVQSGHQPPRTEIERHLCDLWQKLLRTERVGIKDNFFELGGHSLLAVRLFAEIEKITQKKLPLVTLFQAPTIEQLAAVLGRKDAETSQSLLVPIQPNGDKPPLFLVHGAGGDVLWGYANLAAHLPPDQPVYGIKSRGQAGLEEWRTLEEMAVGYLEEVRALQPNGPYYLGGYCFGGNVAYEMARQLHSKGEKVALLALLDSAPANAGYEKVNWWRPSYGYKFARNLYYWWSDFSQLDAKTRLRFVGRKTRAVSRKLWQKLRPQNGVTAVDIEEVIDPGLFPAHELNMWRIHLQALTDHVQKPYPGHAILFRTRGQPLFSSLEEDFCWAALIQEGIEVKLVPGSHESVFVEPNVQHLASELAAALVRTQELFENKPALSTRTPTESSARGLEPVSRNS